MFLTLRNDTHKIALRDDCDDSRNMGYRILVNALKASADELSGIEPRIRRANDPTMKHPRHTHIMHVCEAAQRFVGYIGAIN